MICGIANKVNNPYADILNKKLLQRTNERHMVYDGFSSSQNGDLLINSMLDYGKSVRSQRQQKKDSLISLKTLKYQFKSISSKLINAKTSASARAVVGQAEREVLRLKREKMKGDVDETEIDAAINHAKAMERVARRKVKHLIQEELAKASDNRNCMMLEEKETEDVNTDVENDEEKNAETNKAENNEVASDELTSLSSEYSKLVEKCNDEVEELSEEIMDTLSEEMNNLMEEIGFEEASDVDPSDIKMLIIKHRNREMKEIAKADSDYLKVVFDNLETLKSADVALPTEPTIDVAL